MDDVGTFHRFARAYDLVMPDADGETLARALSHADREIGTVLDLAGGTGRGLRALDGRTVGNTPLVRRGIVLDAATGMLRRARNHGHAAVRGDAGRLPLRDDAVDAIVLVDAFHHLPDRDAVVAEAARVLAPGGILAVQEFDPTTLRGRAVVAGERLVGFDSRFDPPQRLRRRFQQAGLESITVDGGFSYVVAGLARGQ